MGSRGARPSPTRTPTGGLIWSSGTSPRTAPNRLWVGDFTYLRCWEGVVYFAFMLDVFSRMIVGWQLAANMRTELVLDALRMALGLGSPARTSSW